MNFAKPISLSTKSRSLVPQLRQKLRDILSRFAQIGSSLKSIASEVMHGTIPIRDDILAGVVGAVCVVSFTVIGMLIVVFLIAERPVVYKSWSTQKCVMVVTKGEPSSCRNLPEKYDTVWIK